jgi:GDP-4-dehydro-6-deoxy-D-mannose reductase
MGGETVVVTGGAGFVGRYLISELARCRPDWRLVVWDKDTTPVSDAAETVGVDLREPASYERHLQRLKPTWVVHLAAIAAVPAALKDPALVLRVNFEATVKLLETIALLTPATRIFAVSSADIYGSTRLTTSGSTALPELPLTAAQPSNPYAES